MSHWIHDPRFFCRLQVFLPLPLPPTTPSVTKCEVRLNEKQVATLNQL